MSHLNDRTLERLIAGSASATDVQRIRRHIGACRPCARRLEEWRDNFTEVGQRFPELGGDVGPAATVTVEGLVLLPTESRRPGLNLDLTKSLWIGAIFMVLLVGYGTLRVRQAKAVGELPVLSLPQPPQTERESRPVTTLSAIPPVAQGDSLARRDLTPRPPAPAPPSPVPQAPSASLAVSPGFRSASPDEATGRLGGPVRVITGMEPDHFEIGPAKAVPGAQSGLPVVRVVYQASDGRRILLDQQLIPADSSGFRPIEDPRLESGEPVFGTSGNGVSVVTWLDDDGYRLSLAMRIPRDSLKLLLPRVR